MFFKYKTFAFERSPWQQRSVNSGVRLPKVMAKGDGREVGFQDGGYFSKFLKRERINNQTFIAFVNCG